jgi:hypothetical protein
VSGADDSCVGSQNDESAFEAADGHKNTDAHKNTDGQSSALRGDSGEQHLRGRKRRRVTTAPPDGSDPHPTAEPDRHLANENDEQLKGDKPPHWG